VFFVGLYICSKLHSTVFVVRDFFPVIIALGLIVGCTPSLCGRLFSQNTQLYTISTISHGGYHSNGSTVAILLILSFTVLMYLSICGTCSFAAHMFSMIPLCYISCCMCLNCPSTRIAFILNPHVWYACITWLIDVISVLFFMPFTSSASQSVYCMMSSL